MDTIKFAGRTYTVEQITVYGTTQYRFTGKRGAVYETMRNKHTPQAMFVMLGSYPSLRTYWFTDVNGRLEYVEGGMGAVLRMVDEHTKSAASVAPAAVAPADPVEAPASEVEAARSEVARLERVFKAAQDKSTRAMEAKMAHHIGARRGRRGGRGATLNARWGMAAESRDKARDALDAARERLAALDEKIRAALVTSRSDAGRNEPAAVTAG